MRFLSLLVSALPFGVALASESSPNPIATQYPDDVTGTINGTLVVVPIPYKLARSIIPARYGILKNAYQSLLPGFPKDMYPLLVRGILDHGVGIYAYNYSLPDFQSIHIDYPFVDVLGDGYSSFVYHEYFLSTADNLVALVGAGADGTKAFGATFSPDLEAYAYVPYAGKAKSDGEIYLNAFTNLSSKPVFETLFKYTPVIAPWPLNFYMNVTNQPITNAGLTCDNQIVFFNSTLTTGKNKPVGIVGDVTIKAPFLPADSLFKDVHGIKVDTAFMEHPGMLCSELKGYHGTGSGD